MEKYVEADLQPSREALMADLRQIPIVEVEKMFDALLPPARSERFIDDVLKHETVRRLYRNNVWFQFEQGPRSANTENEGFNPLKYIFDAIVQAAPRVPTGVGLPPLSASLVINGNYAPSGDRENRTRPDAFLKFEDPNHTYPSNPNDAWSMIVTAFEFKRADTPQNLRDVSCIPSLIRCVSSDEFILGYSKSSMVNA